MSKIIKALGIGAMIGIVGGIILSLIGWNFNKILTMSIGDLSLNLGNKFSWLSFLKNTYWQTLTIIIVLIILALVVGVSLTKIGKKLSGG